MTATARRRGQWPIVDATAPSERLAMFRITAGGFTLLYLLLRSPVFLELADRPEVAFHGVGLFAVADQPMPAVLVPVVLAVALFTGTAVVVGYRYRLSAPLFAGAVLVLTSYRSSWGQMLHFEHLFTLHVLLLACAPAADALSLDSRRRPPVRRRPVAYGFPLRLACLIVVMTYVIASVAKLRYGGPEWIIGNTLVQHIAYSAARLELLGAYPSPLAQYAVEVPDLWPYAAAVVVIIELAAPVALFGGRWRTMWVLAAWLLHVGTFALMLVGFPYPLFGAAFAPFFELEKVGVRISAMVQNWDERRRSDFSDDSGSNEPRKR